MPPKRKFLTLVERVKVIELNNKNRSARKIAEDFGVGKTQVHVNIYLSHSELVYLSYFECPYDNCENMYCFS